VDADYFLPMGWTQEREKSPSCTLEIYSTRNKDTGCDRTEEAAEAKGRSIRWVCGVVLKAIDLRFDKISFSGAWHVPTVPAIRKLSVDMGIFLLLHAASCP
jgi:hypothetical protein